MEDRKKRGVGKPFQEKKPLKFSNQEKSSLVDEWEGGREGEKRNFNAS